MRLSDAILMGDTLRSRRPSRFLEKTGDGFCGCAIGGALLAIGVEDGNERHKIWPWLKNDNADSPFTTQTWTNETEISNQFWMVCAGKRTLEELVDYVRAIEPAEDLDHTSDGIEDKVAISIMSI